MTRRRRSQRFNWIGWNILLWGGLLLAAVVSWIIDKVLS